MADKGLWCKIEAGSQGHAAKERLAIRRAHSAPLIADLPQLADPSAQRRSGNDPPDRFPISAAATKSRLGEKRGYIHRHWDSVLVFLTDGCVAMGPNPVKIPSGRSS